MTDVPQDAPESMLSITLELPLIPFLSLSLSLSLYFSLEDCPGTQSEDAGKASACQGCPNQGICASGLPKAPDPGKKIHKEKFPRNATNNCDCRLNNLLLS